ncbi:hypothetical protein ACU1JV_00360 [Paenibacillus sp. T2-29]|uniref:hypothetical protein n=1 Tax=Paenibacillus TaxID=44249 RepID=UPI0039BD3589
MNLYKIMFEHFSQKDSQKGILTYLVADSDSEVYEWIKSEPSSEIWGSIFNSYKYKEKDKEVFDVYDNNYNCVSQEGFRDRMIRLHGDMFDEDVELCDLYYGVTLYGWTLVKENVGYDVLQAAKETGINIEVCLSN